MRVAAVQINSGPEIEENLTTVSALINQAVTQGAKWVVLPENFSLMPKSDTDREQAAESEGDGVTQRFMSSQAKSRGIWLVGGTIPFRSQEGGRLRSACFVFNPNGEQIARYDKVHLFDVDLGNGETYKESDYIEPGTELESVEVDDIHVGLTICYDVRFPEMYRALVKQGVNVFTVPSAFSVTTGRAHWELLLRARAVENLSYVIAPAQTGQHANGRETYGHSTIIDPWGQVLACQPEGEGVITADLDFHQQQKTRQHFPALDHCRI